MCEVVGLNEVRSVRLNKAMRGALKAKRVAGDESLRETKGGRWCELERERERERERTWLRSLENASIRPSLPISTISVRKSPLLYKPKLEPK